MQSLSIIQIEELVYGRLNHVSKTDWIAMLKKHGAHADYIIFKDNYFLLEQSDYRFEGNKMISSERVVYNIDYATYDTAENAPDPENTDEIQIVRYDRRTDRYFVRYAHYLPSKDSVPSLSTLLSDICSEADIPSSHLFVQAPPETQATAPRPIQQPIQQPAPTPAPVFKPQPVVQAEQPKKKKWRRLAELEAAYISGKSLQQIVEQFECTKEGAIYQLKNYLGIEHPFERTSAAQPKPSAPAPKTKEKHIGRYTWDGEIILTHLYKHPGATTSEIASAHKSLSRRDINQCLTGYFSAYVEKDKRTGGYRLNQRGTNEIRPYVESLGTPEITLDDYKAMFQTMKRSKTNGHTAPHKVILMLALISYFKKHIVRVMEIDMDMKVYFMDYWRKYVHTDEWSSNIRMPWEHMTSEPFWHWIDENTKSEAYLDDDLFYLIHHDKSARVELKKYLIELL